MIDIETRVRQVMQAEAERVWPGQLRPIRFSSMERERRQRSWLAPVAAALVIATTMAGVAVGVHASGLFGAARGDSSAISSTFSKPPWPGGDNRMPAYYVTVEFGGPINGNSAITMTAVVRSSATGALLRTVPLPNLNGEGGGPVITAAGDDRHFVIALSTGRSDVTRFYLLTLGASGRMASLATLPVHPFPANESVSGIALTPDGTQLAITVHRIRPYDYRGPRPTAEIKAVNLATGSVRIWTTRQAITSDGGPSEPSWGDGGRLLGFQWNAHDGVPDAGLYVLKTTAPGSNLMAARRPFRGIGTGLDAYLTATGQTVIADMDTPDPTPGALHDGYPSIVELSARTGLLIRTLYGPPRIATPAGYGVVSVDPSGKYLLVTTPNFGRLVNGKFTRLAMKPGAVPFAAW